jgi:hypothetical protein
MIGKWVEVKLQCNFSVVLELVNPFGMVIQTVVVAVIPFSLQLLLAIIIFK